MNLSRIIHPTTGGKKLLTESTVGLPWMVANHIRYRSSGLPNNIGISNTAPRPGRFASQSYTFGASESIGIFLVGIGEDHDSAIVSSKAPRQRTIRLLLPGRYVPSLVTPMEAMIAKHNDVTRKNLAGVLTELKPGTSIRICHGPAMNLPVPRSTVGPRQKTAYATPITR